MQREGVLCFLGLELMQFFLKHRAGQGVGKGNSIKQLGNGGSEVRSGDPEPIGVVRRGQGQFLQMPAGAILPVGNGRVNTNNRRESIGD